MSWIFLIVFFFGIFLINLGAMSLLVLVLATAFKAALVLIVLLAGLLVWR